MAKAIMAVKFADDEDISVEQVIATNRGEVVAKTGDGVIAEFTKVAKALECARRINEKPDAPAHRVGLHMGEAQGGAAAQAVKLAGSAAAGCTSISRDVMDAARRIKGGYATSIGKQDFGSFGPMEVLHVWRPQKGEMSGGYSKFLAPALAGLLSLVLVGGYALWKQPSLMERTLGITTAPEGVGPGANARPAFKTPPTE